LALIGRTASEIGAGTERRSAKFGDFAVTHILAAVFGVVLLFTILRSMIRIALMNCHSRDFFAAFTGRAVYAAAALRLRGNRDAGATHRVLLWFFPVYILSLIVVYFLGAMTAFAFLYWGTGAVGNWRQAFISSGSGLNTLGFATPTTIAGQWLSIPEGALGLGLVVFLFTFIPGYQAVIRAREDRTSWLYVRVGSPPTGVRFLECCQLAGSATDMKDIWEAWEDWFRMLGDTHSVLPMLTMSPSVQSDQSWVLAAAAVLHAAALTASSIEGRDTETSKVCVRTGARAFVAIADALGQVHGPVHEEGHRPSRKDYDALRDRLSSAGIPLRPTSGREAQWEEFLLLRDQYEDALLFVASRTLAPIDGIQALCPTLPAPFQTVAGE
jgi:hypothetical protein